MLHLKAVVNRPRILLADDHPITAGGLQALLRDSYEMVGIAADGRELIAKAIKLTPDLVVTDIGMPLINGLDAADQIRLAIPKMRFVFLTMNDNPNLAAATLRLAPVGHVLKHSAASELLTAVNEVMQGRSFVTPRVKPENWAVQKERVAHFSKKLTDRRRDVLQLLGEGHQMKEIADILHVSKKTVEFHKYEIMKSCGLKNNADLVLYANKNRLISF